MIQKLYVHCILKLNEKVQLYWHFMVPDFMLHDVVLQFRLVFLMYSHSQGLSDM
jgi:hypothetical protein